MLTDRRFRAVQRFPAGQAPADLLWQPPVRVPRDHQRAALQGPRGGLCLPAGCGNVLGFEDNRIPDPGHCGVAGCAGVLPHALSLPWVGWGPGQPAPAVPSRLLCPFPRWTAGPWVSSSTSWSTARCPSMAMTTRPWSSRSRAVTTGSPRSSQVGPPPSPCLSPVPVSPPAPDLSLPQTPAG